MFPTFAEFFEMDYAPPQSFLLTEFMADKGPVWDAVVEKHGLKPYKYEEVAAWPFGDAVFGCEYDVMADVTKSRQFGFHDVVDSFEMFPRIFAELQRMKVIP